MAESTLLDGVDTDAIEITEETAKIIANLDALIESCPYSAEDILTAMALSLHFCFEGVESALDEGASIDLAEIVDVTRILGSTVLLGRKIAQKHGN